MKRLKSDAVLFVVWLPQAAGCAWGPAATLPLDPNTRVRVRQDSSSNTFATQPVIEGSLMRAHPDTIVLVDGTQQEWFVPLGVIDQLEVRQRRSNAAVGAGVGAVVGFAVGAVVGAATGTFCEYGGSDCRTASALIIGPIAGAVGAGLGVLIGTWIPAAERWQPMPLEPARLPVGSRRNGVVDVRFRLPF